MVLVFFCGCGDKTEDQANEDSIVFAKCKRRAERGDAQAQFLLGECYADGFGVEKDMAKAVDWYRKAAEQGFADAQLYLGLCYEGVMGGVGSNATEALEWYIKASKQYIKAANQGDAHAQWRLASCYENGTGVEKNEANAVEWYLKAAEQENESAQRCLGLCYEEGKGVKKDEAKAVEWYRKAAEQGDAVALRRLALCYEDGKGVEKDEAKAVEWYREAAEQGDAVALRRLGLCYEDGKGVEKDEAKAVEWYRKAAEQGDAYAQWWLALCYEDGKGVEKDEAKAVEWYRKAAEQGDAYAQWRLALCYEDGKGVEKDEAKAAEWYRKAEERGCTSSWLFYKLGNMSWNGIPGADVFRDEEKAVEYWRKAAGAEDGDEDAKKLCEEIEKNPGWRVAFDHSSLVPDTKIDSFAGISFGSGDKGEASEQDFDLKPAEDFRLVKTIDREKPFRKMDGMDVFLTPETRKPYSIRLFAKDLDSAFDSREAAFVECIAVRDVVTRRYGVVPNFQPLEAQENSAFELPDGFSFVWNLEGVTIELSLQNKEMTLQATNIDLSRTAAAERRALIKKAREDAMVKDGGELL